MLTLDVRKSRILVADDVEAYREMLKELLEEEGFEVVCVEDGNQALQRLQEDSFDLALLDVMMPGCTGFSVCRLLKADPKTFLIPVVLITGLDNLDDKIYGIECGADDFLAKPTNRQELLARTRSLLKLKKFTDELENAATVLASLALSVEAKDPYTEGHCARLSKYSVALAKHLGLPAEVQEALRVGGILHDIGKIAVPEQILQKPGPLTPEERRIMEEHPLKGEHICSPLKSMKLVLPIIRHHHERLDGSGYPDGLKGDRIPITARILTTVDIYDALTTDRPYRKALTREDAFAQIRAEVQRGWWNGRLVDALEQVLNRKEARSVDAGESEWHHLGVAI
jgi:putative two-component system response regulator